MSEWFVERRGTANGIMFAGTALGGLFLPLILPPLISTHGVTVTLRYLSIAVMALLLPVIPLIKPRLPESRVQGPRRREENRAWMGDWRLWALLCINTIQGFAYFVPIVYLPSKTHATLYIEQESARTECICSLYFSSQLFYITVCFGCCPAQRCVYTVYSANTRPLDMINLAGASVFGRVVLGTLSDRVSPWLLATCALALSSISTFVLWGVAGSATAGVLVFGVTYGLVAGGWSSLWNGFVKPLSSASLAILHISKSDA